MAPTTLPITDLERALALVLATTRSARGMSQADAAAASGLSESAIYRIEGSQRHADTAQLERLAGAYGIDSLVALYGLAYEAIPVVRRVAEVTSTPVPVPARRPTR